MPEISRFYGIVIAMYARDHAPPHFHAKYGEHEALIVIATLDILQGWLPSRALELVLLWAQMHRAELMENWRRLSEQQASFNKIEPLP